MRGAPNTVEEQFGLKDCACGRRKSRIPLTNPPPSDLLMWGNNGVGYFGRDTASGRTDEWAIEWQSY